MHHGPCHEVGYSQQSSKANHHSLKNTSQPKKTESINIILLIQSIYSLLHSLPLQNILRSLPKERRHLLNLYCL